MTEPGTIRDADQTAEYQGDAACDAFDRLAEEFAERCRRGESPSIADYARRHPEHARKIRELLPSVAMMERLKGRLRSAQDDAASLHEPTLESLGEYRIVRELGRGGMGIVYEAVQESLGRHVALKVIPRHGLLDAKRRQRFRREAMAVAQLHHTNIVPIFAVGEQDGLPYYAMQYIRGSGLDRLLETWRNDGLVPGADHRRFVARVGIQAAEALQYAPRSGRAAPRRQAGQPAHRRAPGRVDHRLRPGEDGGPRGPDQLRRRGRHAAISRRPRPSRARPTTGATSTAWA